MSQIEALSQAEALAHLPDTRKLMLQAARIRDAGFGTILTYSRKVFIPLTRLCRDSCHYCTFAQPPSRVERSFMSPDEVLDVARRGEAAGCTEALFTLGDKPELRYEAARAALRSLGYETTLDYLRAMAELVLKETGLLPHLNPGVMTASDMAMLRPVAASMGLMLEETAQRLLTRGGAHFGSPDKEPAARLATMAAAGALDIPFTSGLLIGIGETRQERVEALLALRDVHDHHGHLQEIIIQPFRPKPGTRMATFPTVPDDDLLWTIAVARIIFGPGMSIQTPPNLAPNLIPEAIEAGINDWGGISPVTADHVNPEAPWPHIEMLADRVRACGRELVQRLPIYPKFARDLDRWIDAKLHSRILAVADGDLMARDSDWVSGDSKPPAPIKPIQAKAAAPAVQRHSNIDPLLAAAARGAPLSHSDIVQLFSARGADFDAVCQAADELRAQASGDTIRYVVNRNINYTNVCSYRCAFCAFSKGKQAKNLRGPAYDLDPEEIGRRVREAHARGATEVCMQGGIHPDYTGETYLSILRTVKDAVPDIHVHAFSPLEVRQGAQTLGIPVEDFLKRLRDAGLGSLPGTAAEILDDEIRSVICPDKLRTQEWIDVIETAHRVKLRTTATIMYGHVETPVHWARHILVIRAIQERTGGFTEFVPLPFVHMEAPMYLNGRARRGPTWREAILMHAVARLALNPVLSNIQVSWVKMGIEGAKSCLRSGANDLGGTLMNESISRAAGASHGQELPPVEIDAIIASLGRTAEQRTTLYKRAPDNQRRVSYNCTALSPPVQSPAGRFARLGSRRNAELAR